MNKKEILEFINSRKSTKKYKSDMPKKEDIDAIISAGLHAASGMNRQSPVIIAITDKAVRDRLMKKNASILGTGNDPFYGAPVILCVVARREGTTFVNDGSLCLGNMMLAAHALGLGSCWIHRAKQTFEDPEWQAFLREIGVEGDFEGIGHLALGYADHTPEEKPRKENRVFYV